MNQLPLFGPIEVPLTQGKVGLVDPVDADLISLKWYAYRHRQTWYVRRGGGSHRATLHRLILSRMLGRPLTSTEMVDHINGNGLDNRRENLRLATASQNQQNRGKQQNNTCGVKGVYWDKQHKRWRARIWCNGQSIHIGFFTTLEEAAAAYCVKARELFGEFARAE